MHYREDIRGEVKPIGYKPSPLIQGGLEIPIEVTVKWEDRKAMHKKVERMSYALGDNDRYIDKSILNDMCLSVGEVDEM